MFILRSLYMRLTGRTSVEGIMSRFTAVADDLRHYAEQKQLEAEDLDNVATALDARSDEVQRWIASEPFKQLLAA